MEVKEKEGKGFNKLMMWVVIPGCLEWRTGEWLRQRRTVGGGQDSAMIVTPIITVMMIPALPRRTINTTHGIL